MDDYNQEQLQTFTMVLDCLKRLPPSTVLRLQAQIATYLQFRKAVDRFLERHFSTLCTQACYESRQSACCGREGITTFFADVVINTLMSQEKALEKILCALKRPSSGFKCVYLAEAGCLWHVKPIVCQMFLCRPAREKIFNKDSEALDTWKELRHREKKYTWPDRPVLFDELEVYFREKGLRSSLMYFHNSPGLLTVKASAKNVKRTIS